MVAIKMTAKVPIFPGKTVDAEICCLSSVDDARSGGGLLLMLHTTIGAEAKKPTFLLGAGQAIRAVLSRALGVGDRWIGSCGELTSVSAVTWVTSGYFKTAACSLVSDKDVHSTLPSQFKSNTSPIHHSRRAGPQLPRDVQLEGLPVLRGEWHAACLLPRCSQIYTWLIDASIACRRKQCTNLAMPANQI